MKGQARQKFSPKQMYSLIFDNKLLSFKKFSGISDTGGRVFNIFPQYFMNSDDSRILRGQEWFQQFKEGHGKLEKELRDKLNRLGKKCDEENTHMDDCLDPLVDDLYKAYKILHEEYRISNEALFQG